MAASCGGEESPPQQHVAIMLGWHLQDEMKALQWINSLLLLSGYLGFLATWILDQLYVVTHKAGLATANRITQRVLRILFPHFNLARQGASPTPSHPSCPHRLTQHCSQCTEASQWCAKVAFSPPCATACSC